MILQRLAEHYDRVAASDDEDHQLAPAGFSRQKISFCVVLEPDGRLNSFQALLEKKGKLAVATPMIVPGQGKPPGQGINPCFLWDNASYMLGWNADAEKLSRSALTFEAFRKKHIALEEKIAHPAFSAVCAFLRSWSPEQSMDHQERLEEVAGNFGVFRIAGEKGYVHELVSLPNEEQEGQEDSLEKPTSELMGMCLVTGSEGVLARLHEPSIKGVPGAQAAGARIVLLQCRCV